jgi:anti-anti-sigma factor
MNSVITSKNNTLIASISGDVDIFHEDALKQIERDAEAVPNFVVDAEKLHYTDTVFLRFLLRIRSQPNKGTRDSVRIVHATRQLRRVLEVTGLTKMFTLEQHA